MTETTSAHVKTVTASLNKLLGFKSVAMQWGNQNAINTQTKLWFAIQKSEKAINKALADVFDINDEEQEEIEAIERNYQATDPSGVLVYKSAQDRNGNPTQMRQYTKDGEAKMSKEVKECRKKYSDLKTAMLFDEDGNEKEVELRVHIASEYPRGLDPRVLEVFKGIVLDSTSTERIEIQLA